MKSTAIGPAARVPRAFHNEDRRKNMSDIENRDFGEPSNNPLHAPFGMSVAAAQEYDVYWNYIFTRVEEMLIPPGFACDDDRFDAAGELAEGIAGKYFAKVMAL